MTTSDGHDPLPDYALANRQMWDESAHEWVASGERNWDPATPLTWGIWGIPESEINLLPASMAGMDAIELGCGTGYVSAWMARRGARVVGVDNSEQQLATARRLATQHGIDLTLHHGIAEDVSYYPDGSFDFAISEYGAAIWADPYRWIPEAHRLLRPGGQLVFLGNHPFTMVCSPPNGATPITERLEQPYFNMYRLDWRDVEVDPGGVEFNLPISKWIALFNATGFVVEDYLELQCPEPGSQVSFFVTADWAHRWPSEQVWKLRKR